MTEVLDLATGTRIDYSCSPAEAVVCAYEQSRRHNNTWQYDWSQARFGPSGRTVFCGDFGAILVHRARQMRIFDIEGAP